MIAVPGESSLPLPCVCTQRQRCEARVTATRTTVASCARVQGDVCSSVAAEGAARALPIGSADGPKPFFRLLPHMSASNQPPDRMHRRRPPSTPVCSRPRIFGSGESDGGGGGPPETDEELLSVPMLEDNELLAQDVDLLAQVP